MKSILATAALCMTVALCGCSNNKSSTAPGAVSECGANCESACSKKGAAPAAMGEGCAKECSGKAAPAAMGEGSCGATCPVTGKPVGQTNQTNMGAVGEGCKASGSCCPSQKKGS